MKVTLTIIIVLISFVSSLAQNNLTVYFGNKNKIGFEFMYSGNTTWGLGGSVYLGKGGVGENYSKTMGPSAYPKDIYEVVVADNASFYGIIGKKITENLTVTGNLGFSAQLKYYNAYDKYQILSPGGHYYTAVNNSTDILYGGSVQYNINHVTPYIGYDNFNGTKVGIGVTF